MQKSIFSGVKDREKKVLEEEFKELEEYSPIVFNLTGGMLLIGVILQIILMVLGAGKFTFSMLIDIIISVGLFRKSDTFSSFALLRAGLGAIVWPMYIIITKGMSLGSIIVIVLQLLYCIPIILLLYGREKKWKKVLSVVMYGIFVLIMLFVIMGAIISHRSL